MFISIIIPLFNKGYKVCRSIDSVLRQKYQKYEIIVVDDGSIDDSAFYVKQYSDERIKYIYQANAGVSAARNKGIEKANGDWLYFLDADDEIADNALSSFVALHNMFPDVKFLVGQSLWFQNGKQLNTKSITFDSYTTKTPYFDIWMNKYRPGIRNILVHRSIVKKNRGFDERMSFFEDWEFPLRIISNAKIAVTSDVVGVYNQDSDGLSCSSHPLEKEMAYYTPELLENASFWKKCLLYSNIEQAKNYWMHDRSVISFYEKMQKTYFSYVFKLIHNLRQKLQNKNII